MSQLHTLNKLYLVRAAVFSLATLLTGCLGGHEDPHTISSYATGNLTLVSYDANTAALTAQGSVNYSGVTAATVVQLHLSATCIDNPIGQGVESDFTGAGISLTVPSTTVSSIYVIAAGVPGCQPFATYNPAYSAPPVPTFLSSSPMSPSRVNSTPSILGAVSGYTASVSLYSDAACSTVLASGSANTFKTLGLGVTLPLNQTSKIYAKAFEAFGKSSDCVLLTSYTHTTSGPAAPVFASTSPTSPTNLSSAPTLIGTVDSTTTQVAVFSEPSCTTQLGTTTAALFTTTGLQVTVQQNAATTLYGIAYDSSGAPSVCGYLSTFVHDTIGPAAPTFVSASPASPTNASVFPLITGLASADTVQVKLFKGLTCTQQIGIGTKAQFESGAMTAGITPNSTTLIYGAAFDSAGNQSSCANLSAYTHNTIAPDPPVYNITSPQSPNNQSTTPLVLGTVSDSTVAVRFFSEETCSTAIGSGTADDFVTPGIQVTAISNATTPIYAQAVDAESNRSACTLMVNYMHSTQAAPAPVFQTSVPLSPSNTSSTPYIIGTAASTVARVTLYGDSACAASLGSASRATFATVGIQVNVPNNRVTPIYGISLDVYGNTSACTSLTSYTYDTKVPSTPFYASVAPTSPNNTSITPIIKGLVAVDGTNVLPVTTVNLYDSLLCLNNIGTGTPAQFTGAGITLNVNANSITNVYAKTYDAAGNFSDCTY